MTGVIFDMQRFSVNDGPGIRTTVFFKGCPLRCLWCHNPESKRAAPELLYYGERCIGCGACREVCERGCHTVGEIHEFRRDACAACGRCAAVCPEEALRLAGRRVTVEEVLAYVLRDRPFYETSGGGMTLSGGEPMAQLPFVRALLTAAKAAGLHTAMETCGYAPWEQYREVAPLVDLFLYDFKETDDARHRRYTGVSNVQILENLRRLDGIGAEIVLRCPIIPSYNDTEAHFSGIAATANALHGIREIHVEPYHPLGKSKAEALGISYEPGDLPFVETERECEWIAALSRMTRVPVKRG